MASAGGRARTRVDHLLKYKERYLLLIPTLVLFLVFRYVPMAGDVLAWKQFTVTGGLFGSPWAGWKFFERLFASPEFFRVLRHPEEELGFEPASFIWEEHRCIREHGEMVTATGDGRTAEVEFSLYPALTGHAEVDLELEVRRDSGPGNLVLSAGFDVNIGAGRLEFASRAIARFESGNLGRVQRRLGAAYLDTSRWHTYRLERRPGGCRVLVDGRQVLASDDASLRHRPVRFGAGGELQARWRSGRARVYNPGDYSIDWSWHAGDGFPDQFQRDRTVVLDYTSDSGYSDWTQLADGTIVIADYTSDSYENINAGGPQPILKAYRVREEDLE
ncbi:MAG: hypothetical protein OXP69_06790 [Spirochaetaceae bacterium]|nr:hypothetical protein [Spirochaetaceae bacterium]